MKAIYIGGLKYKKQGKSKWKFFLSLFLFLSIVGAGLKVSAPMIIESWINQKGESSKGYAFSIRETDISIGKGQMILMDVKIFNHKTMSEMIEVPKLTIQLSWSDLLLSQEKNVSITADKVDLTLSKDLSSEMERIEAVQKQKRDLYLDNVVGKIGQLNIIEKKESISRTVLELKSVDLKVKEISLLSINEKTQFSVSSNIAGGGKLALTGKTSVEDGRTPWSISGSLKQVPSDIFNKIAGDKLPFAFNESSLNAEIVAHSDHGIVSGEISPEIKRLNLLNEKPGVPTESIARLLTDELTFSLQFTLKDELKLEFEEEFRKLKTYRKGMQPSERSVAAQKSFSIWPF